MLASNNVKKLINLPQRFKIKIPPD